MRRAVAGPTTTRSARLAEAGVRDGLGGSSHSEVRAGSEAERREGGRAHEPGGAGVRTGRHVGARVDQPAAHLDGLVGRDAPDTPSTTLLPAEIHRARSGGGVTRRCRQRRRWPRRAQPLRLPPRPRAPRPGRHTILSAAISSNAIDSGLRASEVTCGGTMAPEAVAELAEVGVDLARPVGPERDEAELGLGPVEEALDRRVHHRVVLPGHGTLGGRRPPVGGEGWEIRPEPGTVGAGASWRPTRAGNGRVRLPRHRARQPHAGGRGGRPR